MSSEPVNMAISWKAATRWCYELWSDVGILITCWFYMWSLPSYEVFLIILTGFDIWNDKILTHCNSNIQTNGLWVLLSHLSPVSHTLGHCWSAKASIKWTSLSQWCLFVHRLVWLHDMCSSDCAFWELAKSFLIRKKTEVLVGNLVTLNSVFWMRHAYPLSTDQKYAVRKKCIQKIG